VFAIAITLLILEMDVQPSLAICNGRETPAATYGERLDRKGHQQALQSGPLVYLVATVLAFVSVPLSLAIIIGLAVLYLLPYRPPPMEP
jgi:hypothetical protein